MAGVTLRDGRSPELDLEAEWYDRHHQEHTRNQTQLGRTCS